MGLIRWAKKAYLKRKIRKEWRSQTGALTEEKRMEISSSKEQWVNMISTAASVIGALNSEAIAGWFTQSAEAIESGSLEITLTCVVTAIISTSRFFSRLNRD